MRKHLKPLFSRVSFLTLFSVLFALPHGAAEAAVSPISLSILPPVQFPSEEFTITGARVSVLWGRQRHVYGIDLGVLGNITSQNFVGVGVSGLLNMTHGQTTVLGLQLAGLANINTQKTSVYGLQATLGINRNTAASSVSGIQLGLIANLSKFTDIYGAQIGLFNHAQTVNGLQIGLVNVASSLRGVQIGLVNYHQKGTVSVSPIINIGF